MGRRCQGGKGADDVLRREYIGTGVHRVNKAHGAAERIVPGKICRAQILAAGIQEKNGGGHGDGNAQELTVALKGIHIVQQGIQVDAHDEKIPAHIENKKALVEGNPVIQRAVHHMVGSGRVIKFDEKVSQQVNRPEQQPPQMAVLGLVDVSKAEIAKIRLRFRKSHGRRLRYLRRIRDSSVSCICRRCWLRGRSLRKGRKKWYLRAILSRR